MKEFKDRVAVITGAASGIGRALAERCAREGMKVVLSDVEKSALLKTESEIKATGASVLAVLTDVSQIHDVKSLAWKTLDTYGAVHLLCNNAGVMAGSTVWESTINDWRWVMGVNFWGVIYCLREFIPIMLKQNVEAQIVNTASVAGLMPFHGSAAYQVTKHAVIAISEKLYYDMMDRGGKIKVSVLCPEFVRTDFMDSSRNRPARFGDDDSEIIIAPESGARLEEYRKAVESGMPPDEVADCVFRAISDEMFYIFTQSKYTPLVKARMDAILQRSNPLPQGQLRDFLKNQT